MASGSAVAAVGANDLDALKAVVEFPLPIETVDHCDQVQSGTSTVTYTNAKAMRAACLAYRKQETATRSNPCLDDAEPVDLRGGGDAVDVVLHSVCGYTVNPVYSLGWRAGAWKLTGIGIRSPE
jgi:hypothetical protein